MIIPKGLKIHPLPIEGRGEKRNHQTIHNETGSKQAHMPLMQTWLYAILVHRGLIERIFHFKMLMHNTELMHKQQ